MTSWILCSALVFGSSLTPTPNDLNQVSTFSVSATESFGKSVSNAGDIDGDGYDDFIIGAPQKKVGGMSLGGAYVVYGAKDLTPSSFDFSTTPLVPSSTGFTIIGAISSGSFGYSVGGACDIDGDGYDDIMMGAPFVASSQGKVYVLFGGQRSSLNDRNLGTNALVPGTDGFTITGTGSGQLGASVSCAGDINDDGYDDIIIGAFQLNSNQGAVYVIYGGPRNTLIDINLATPLNYLTNGFRILGGLGTYFGWSVSRAGDLNGDGNDDIIIGARGIYPGSGSSPVKGAAYVFYGGQKASLPGRDLSTNPLMNSPDGFTITPVSAEDYFGSSVSGIGDIDGDHHDDIIIGAPNINGNQGAAYVIYGGNNVDIDLASAPLIQGVTGFTIRGELAGDFCGYSVSNASDVNGDGLSDILIGAYGKTTSQGAIYVIYGGDRGSLMDIDLSAGLDIHTQGFSVSGIAADGRFGASVRNAGDVNGDGFGDIIIGANGNTANKAYILTYNRCPEYCSLCTVPSKCDSCLTEFVSSGDVCVCPTGKYPEGTTCESCVGNCDSCTNSTKCITCTYPYNFHQGLCYDSCPEKTFDNNDYTCGDCPLNCDSCPTSSVCITCTPPTFKYLGLCYTECPIETFASGTICKTCPSDCDVCSDENTCTTCSSGYYLYNNQCASICPGNTFITTSPIAKCENCSLNCDSCTDNSTCTTCTSPFLKYQGRCVGTCPPKYFSNSGICSDCPTDCDVCNDQNTCTTCSSGYFLSASQCYSTCPLTTYSVGSNCLGCSSNCKRCTSGTNCMVCSDGSYLWQAQCENSCPTGTFISDPTSCGVCPSNCDQCSSGSTCSVCSQEHFLYKGKCFSRCPLHTYYDTSSKTCLDCQENCVECTGPTTCEYCFEGYLFSGSACVDHCPTGLYPSDEVCHTCPAGCSECTSGSNCQSCSVGFVKFKSQCLTGCPAKTYLENSASVCFDCSEGCLKCTSGTECQVCEDGFMLSDSHTCVQHFEETAKDKAPPALFESTSLIGASLTSGSSLPLNFGLVAKILRNIKYMDLTVSPELQKTFYSWKTSTGFMSAPDSLREKSPPKGLPYVFARYALEPVFLVNYWKPFLMTIIGFVLFVIFKGLEIKFEKEKEKKIYSISRQINVIASNFALTQFYSNLDDVVLYVAIQLRSTQYNSAFGAFSFGVAIILSTIGVIILSFHSSLLGKYQSSKREKSQSLETFTQKYENYKLIFADFKDTNYLTQSFLFFNLLRALLSSLIIATLYQYPGVQIAFLLILNLAMLTFLSMKKPFKELVDTCGQIFCELVLLVANISVLILIVCDQGDSSSYGVIEKLSQCIIVLNFILLFGCATLLLVNIGKMLWKVYQEKKQGKKSSEKSQDSTNIKSLFDSAKFTRPSQSLENKTDQSLMPMATNDISSELFNNNASRTYQNNQSPDLSYNQSVLGFESPNMLFKQTPMALSESYVMENPLDFESHKNSRKESNEPLQVIESNLKPMNEVGEMNQEKLVHKSSMDQSIRRRRGGKVRIMGNNGNGHVSVDVSPQINSKKVNMKELTLEMDIINLDEAVEN